MKSRTPEQEAIFSKKLSEIAIEHNCKHVKTHVWRAPNGFAYDLSAADLTQFGTIISNEAHPFIVHDMCRIHIYSPRGEFITHEMTYAAAKDNLLYVKENCNSHGVIKLGNNFFTDEHVNQCVFTIEFS